MATTAQVIYDQAQSDGRRRVLYRYTHDSNETFDHGPFLIASGTNAQTDANARINVVDDQMEKQEIRRGVYDFIKGKDLDQESYPVNGITIIRFEALKFLMNMMKSSSDVEDKVQVIKNVTAYVTKYTNSQIANLINAQTGGDNWDAVKVGLVKTKLSTLVTTYDNLDHGEPEIDG